MTKFQKKAMKLGAQRTVKHCLPELSWLSRSAVNHLSRGYTFVVDFEKPSVPVAYGRFVPEYVRTYGIFNKQGNRIPGFGRVTFQALREARLIVQFGSKVEKKKKGKPLAKVYYLISQIPR